MQACTALTGKATGSAAPCPTSPELKLEVCTKSSTRESWGGRGESGPAPTIRELREPDLGTLRPLVQEFEADHLLLVGSLPGYDGLGPKEVEKAFGKFGVTDAEMLSRKWSKHSVTFGSYCDSSLLAHAHYQLETPNSVKLVQLKVVGQTLHLVAAQS